VHLFFDEGRPGRLLSIRSIRVIPLPDLVRMKLTRHLLKDQMHVKDLDEVGLITPEVEAALSPLLLGRLAQIRKTD
jgi:hypothetical protein